MTHRPFAASTLALLLAATALGQQATVSAVAGDTITLSVGVRDGVRRAMTGTVLASYTVGGRTTVEEIATFRVTAVRERDCDAERTGGNVPVARGMEARLDLPLATPSPRATATPAPPRPTATPAPWAPEAGRDLVFFITEGDCELAKGRLDQAEIAYQKVRSVDPGNLLGCQGVNAVAARRRELEEEERRQIEAERRERERMRLQRFEVARRSPEVFDTGAGLIWTRRDNGSAVNWFQANTYCEQLTTAGWTEWRLPSIDELQRFASRLQVSECCAWSSTEKGANRLFFHIGARERGSLPPSEQDRLRVVCVGEP